jgi:hypothetical protein
MGARCGAALAVARLSHALGRFQGRECPVTTEAAYHHIRAEQYWPEDVPGRLSCLGAEESMHICEAACEECLGQFLKLDNM